MGVRRSGPTQARALGARCHVLVFLTAHADGEKVFFVSITHLTFDRRLPLAREIAVYQKHRIKRIRRSSSTPFSNMDS